MGSLTLPASGIAYLDTDAFIYSLEGIPPYDAVIAPMWEAARDGRIVLATSELTLLQTLVRPVQIADRELERSYRELLTTAPEVRIEPTTRGILELGARLRAEVRLNTPDAIHGATAIRCGAVQLLTSDPGFRRVDGIPVILLQDFVGA